MTKSDYDEFDNNNSTFEFNEDDLITSIENTIVNNPQEFFDNPTIISESLNQLEEQGTNINDLEKYDFIVDIINGIINDINYTDKSSDDIFDDFSEEISFIKEEGFIGLVEIVVDNIKAVDEVEYEEVDKGLENEVPKVKKI